jgi:hypothetical protein
VRQFSRGDLESAPKGEKRMNIRRINVLILAVLAAIGQVTCAAAELPSSADVESALNIAYEKYRSLQEGKNAD